MAGLLPLTPAQARELWEALSERPEHEVDETRLVERVVMRLVELIGSEADVQSEWGDLEHRARQRARRVGAAAGLGGFLSAPVQELVELVEETRVAGEVADGVDPGRAARDRAADLLVLWGLSATHADARAALDGTGPGVMQKLASTTLANRGKPSTVRQVISLLLRARDLAGGHGGLSALPLVGAPIRAWKSGREMDEWVERVRTYYAAA